ncbi:hypothetical protein SCP_0202030 [Sparassis crispa]|uniref:Thioredoxin domain-containing protein n=1 Tax=Sparassis crispa TaxID=139825 RepID=A0A401G9Z2_9APHY|nr:hypothetical protein SCP_0202030 [Sparassis crispa]GBE79006.1 hypothetical protein SCP_0202030 [Sparassis crispa]
MKLSAALAQLPYSLLVASLTLTAIAAPVESVGLDVLEPDNFESTIAQGVWFIEHFSPYCPHCRDFMPTWEQLVADTQKSADPGIHLAQVNCAINGDLCTKNGVTGYPQMNLYRNGVFQEMFSGARDYDRLTAFISTHAEPTTVAEPEPEPEPEPTSAPAALVVEDRYIAEHRESYRAAPARDLNPSGTVLELNENTFRDVVDDGMIFVKFFAPWCGHCKKLAPVWRELAVEMQHKLAIAEVNCDDHNALCHAEGVTGFPMLVYYGGKDGGKTEYTSGRKLEQLKAFAEKISGPPMREMNFEDLHARVEEHPVLYLLLHPPTSNWPINHLLDASHILFGSPPIYTSTSSRLYSHFGITPDASIILALKDGDDAAPAAVYQFTTQANADHEKESLTSWLLRNRLPLSLALSSDNFQDVMNAPHKPLVVLAAAAPSALQADIAPEMRELARQWRDARGSAAVVFAWMDAERWASWLKGMYGIKPDALPRVVIADHSGLVYWDTDHFGEKIQLSSSSLFSAINGALSRTIKPKHSENFVERMARYLNGRLMATEKYVSAHPWSTVCFVLLFVAVFAWALLRLFADSPEFREVARGKGDRLD